VQKTGKWIIYQQWIKVKAYCDSESKESWVVRFGGKNVKSQLKNISFAATLARTQKPEGNFSFM
jgi:hypothetical protein